MQSHSSFSLFLTPLVQHHIFETHSHRQLFSGAFLPGGAAFYCVRRPDLIIHCGVRGRSSRVHFEGVTNKAAIEAHCGTWFYFS